MRFSWKYLFLGTIGVGVCVFFGVWSWFHSIPRLEDLRQMLRDADEIEIFRLVDDTPTRWIRLSDPELWRPLPEMIEFKARYWEFSRPPTDSIVFQVIRAKERYGAWEVRGDGHLHIRKAARWYRMPIAGGFEERVRSLLAERGSDLERARTPPRAAL